MPDLRRAVHVQRAPPYRLEQRRRIEVAAEQRYKSNLVAQARVRCRETHQRAARAKADQANAICSHAWPALQRVKRLDNSLLVAGIHTRGDQGWRSEIHDDNPRVRERLRK